MRYLTARGLVSIGAIPGRREIFQDHHRATAGWLGRSRRVEGDEMPIARDTLLYLRNCAWSPGSVTLQLWSPVWLRLRSASSTRPYPSGPSWRHVASQLAALSTHWRAGAQRHRDQGQGHSRGRFPDRAGGGLLRPTVHPRHHRWPSQHPVALGVGSNRG